MRETSTAIPTNGEVAKSLAAIRPTETQRHDLQLKPNRRRVFNVVTMVVENF